MFFRFPKIFFFFLNRKYLSSTSFHKLEQNGDSQNYLFFITFQVLITLNSKDKLCLKEFKTLII